MSVRLQVLLEEEEMVALKQRARQENMTVCEWVRRRSSTRCGGDMAAEVESGYLDGLKPRSSSTRTFRCT